MRRRELLGAAMAMVGASPARAADPTIVAHGLMFPEGPIAFADGTLMCVEIGRGTLSRIRPDGTASVVSRLGGGPNGAAIGPDGACYVVNNGGLLIRQRDGGMSFTIPPGYEGGFVQRVDLRTGAFTTLYTGVGGNRLRAPDDIVFDGHGGFWFTDTGKIHSRYTDHGGIYWGRPDGSEVREVVYPLITPNGIALSPDRRTLYATLSLTRQLVSFRIIGPGRLAQRDGRPDMTILAGLGGTMILDSMCVEADGTLVVAAVLAGKMLRRAPDGTIVGEITLPDRAVTNGAFGGPDLRTLYVTLSQTGRIAAVPWRWAGLKLLYR